MARSFVENLGGTGTIGNRSMPQKIRQEFQSIICTVAYYVKVREVALTYDSSMHFDQEADCQKVSVSLIAK